MNTQEQVATNERALQELQNIQADMDNHRDPETYKRKVDYLSELVSDLPRARQAHFFAEARRMKITLDVTGSADGAEPANPKNDGVVDPANPQPGGTSPP